MKFAFVAGTVALAFLMAACDAENPENPRLGNDNAGAGDGTGDVSGAQADGPGDASTSVDDGDAGDSKGDPRGSADAPSDAGADGSGSDAHGDTGSSKGHDAGSSHHDHGTAGATGDDDDSAGGAHGDSDHGSAGEDGTSGGLAGATGTGGSSGSGGAGGTSSSAGAGGLPGSGGFGGLPSDTGSGGLPSDTGSGGLPSDTGSGGLSSNGGSGGLSGTGGVGGSTGGDGGVVSLDPEYLFTKETFGGNGRTCVTCHTAATGTISPAEVQALYASDPEGPLFRPVDGNDGASADYTALRDRATFRATIPLPPGVFLTSDPSATTFTVRRSVPTTINTPALDSVLMWDGRAPSLTEQALGAIQGHAQATVTPTAEQLELIAQFEQGPDFFSSELLREYSQGGPAPTWPPGVSDAEQRGRRWFAQDSAAPRFNICGQCHGGAMANETQSNSGLPVGKHFQTVNVSEFNTLGNPTFEFTFPDPKNPGKTVTVVTPDPGRALVTGDVRDLNFFKIPTLWGVKNTAPYFHDNSANTLEELVDHYEKHLATFLPKNRSYPAPHVPTAQDKADIVAYLKLL